MPDTITVDDDHPNPLLPRPHRRLILALEADRPTVGGASFSLEGVNEVLIGRGEARTTVRTTADDFTVLKLTLPGRSVSSLHARLIPSQAGWIVEDAGSRNGTIVSGRRVDRAVLGDEDVLEIGRSFFLTRTCIAERSTAAILDRAVGPGSVEEAFATIVPELHEKFAALRKIAASNVTVLLNGETGTGKELVARAIHETSGRSGRFVAVNCGALPVNLVESQLFGHVRGAFSDAVRDEPGLVRAADGGTLLLDEIADLPLTAQATLLRVLQEREVTPVGGTRAIPVDLRVIAATHRSLRAQVAARAFRDDLYARLAGFVVELPPLRKRKEDLGIMIATQLRRLAPRAGVAPSFSAEAARALFAHDWPHNIRELQRVLESSMALSGDVMITPAHLPTTLRKLPVSAAISPSPEPEAETTAAIDEEDQRLRVALLRSLREHGGNVAAVARTLNKAPMQIHRWMKRFDIDPDSFRRR